MAPGTILRKTGVPYAEWSLSYMNGCLHGCLYCYAFGIAKRFKRMKMKEWREPVSRFPGQDPVKLLEEELAKKKKQKSLPKEVHLCFNTDPFPHGPTLTEDIRTTSEKLIEVLSRFGVRAVVLSKGDLPQPGFGDGLLGHGHKWGITLTSLDHKFQQKWEPGAASPGDRINRLRKLSGHGEQTWVSIEPLPPPEIHSIDLQAMMKAVEFVDEIVLGRWNYYNFKSDWSDWYREQVDVALTFCRTRGITLLVKDIMGQKLSVMYCLKDEPKVQQQRLDQFEG